LEIVRSSVLGFCYGVKSTIEKANSCLKAGKKENLPAYSIGALIHNADITRYFESEGLKVIKKPEDATPGIALIRAHGIPDSLREDFIKAGYKLVDSTCHNILSTKKKIREAHNEGRKVIVLGVKNHAETLCLLGTRTEDGKDIECTFISETDNFKAAVASIDPETPIIVVTQTTFPKDLYFQAVAVIRLHFKDIVIGNKPCHACVMRQVAALNLADECDAVIVVGGKKSENTNNLAEIIKQTGKPVWLIENGREIDNSFVEIIRKFDKVGVCSGTSTPTEIIEEVIAKLYN
jgi:4-hydroxy-3-methylbut-2-enyl diphosphate reductase